MLYASKSDGQTTVKRRSTDSQPTVKATMGLMTKKKVCSFPSNCIRQQNKNLCHLVGHHPTTYILTAQAQNRKLT